MKAKIELKERMYIPDIVNRLRRFREDYGQGIEPCDDEALNAAIYLIQNMTNLQAALYDPENMDFISELLENYTCFDFKEGLFTSYSKADFCESCPFYDKETDICGGYGRSEYKKWMEKQIAEEKPWKFYLGRDEDDE